ncbi:MAG: hypothetical protein IJB00_08395 [Akkermansia sp.]|nr:hypothetical protein [Akkermansia sp.]
MSIASLMEILQSNALLITLGVILAAILFFVIFKGVIKMIVLASAIICAVAAWMFLQRNGFTYLSFVTDTPQPWMVQALAWGVGVFILLLFFHIISWFSQLFTWKKKLSAGGIITTILMCLLMLWVGVMGLSYYGSIAKIRHYHELAEAQINGAVLPTLPWSTQASEALRKHPWTGWVEYIDLMDNREQTNLACLVAFGCSLDEPTYTAFYNAQLAQRGIPQPTRFLQLFGDTGLRTLVKEGRFVTLLENEHLTTFLQFRDTAAKFRNIL